MYDDFDDDDAFRNARRRTSRRPRPTFMGGRYIGPVAQTVPMQAVAAQPSAPWSQPPAPAVSPMIDRSTGRFKLGFMLDAAAQALAALSALPAAPPVQGESRVDFTNLLKYQEQLAQHAKRDEQIRTIGALARLFLV